MIQAIVSAIGIMSAMPQEGELILKEMENVKVHQVGKKEFVEGTIQGIPVVFSLSGIGKVSAATTATMMIEKFAVDEIVFTGTAGGGEETNIGDIVIGQSFIQHDVDLSPIFSKFYIYSLDKQVLESSKQLVKKMKRAVNRYLEKNLLYLNEEQLRPKVHEGLILSGDQFIHCQQMQKRIVDSLKEVDLFHFHAIEMEGAAVAQVCHELEKPFVIIRAISDKADHHAGVSFETFIEQIARYYSIGIVKEYLAEKKKT
jgi:adenosylhomocysteine nucleosidase